MPASVKVYSAYFLCMFFTLGGGMFVTSTACCIGLYGLFSGLSHAKQSLSHANKAPLWTDLVRLGSDFV